MRVLGVGSDEFVDDDATEYDQLILIESSVNVLTRTTTTLLNPRGWYCFDVPVAAVGQTVIVAHCDARLAHAQDGAWVIAGGDIDSGVMVLGRNKYRCVR